ncbi:MAG: hypothetical protein HZB18_14460 [Chloroflexi bacterium]|nr:hypothetical protein [Chloroflexota bacterium]
MKKINIPHALLLMLLCSFLIGCSVQPQQEQIYSIVRIENKNSQLLPAMLTVEDFSPEWHWYSAQLKQVNNSSVDNTHGLLEESILHITAYYKNKDIPVTIWQILSRYQEAAPQISSENIKFRTNGQVFPSFDLPVENSDATQCIDMGDDTTCISLLNLKEISIHLEITAPTKVKKETVQMWLSLFMYRILEELH